MAGWKTRNNNSSTMVSELWRNGGPSAFQLQVSMLKCDKIWCAYLVVNCVSLRTFWTPLVSAQHATDVTLHLKAGAWSRNQSESPESEFWPKVVVFFWERLRLWAPGPDLTGGRPGAKLLRWDWEIATTLWLKLHVPQPLIYPIVSAK